MTIFKADIISDNIIITEDRNILATIPIRDLFLNTGIAAENFDSFEIDQQVVNYLDSVKDGTNVAILRDLNIYPKALISERGQAREPTFPSDLKNFEKKISDARKDYLEHTSWLKVKKGSLLDSPKSYARCLWESGLGYDNFLSDPDNVITVKTFGSFIDPLEKQNADEVWPIIGSTIKLTKNFMKRMGFGDYSFVEAKTITSKEFEYTMNIGCGNECSTGENQCSLTQNGDKKYPTITSDTYFAGNKLKKQFIKSSAKVDQKIKFIVIKEWGDKVQVLIYLIYYHKLKYDRGDTVVMITCDMVVFMLCLNLAIPCIFTGSITENGKKMYSILEYKPSDTPYGDALARLNTKIKNINDENQTFITALENIKANPDTPVYIGETTGYRFKSEFYQALLNDIKSIQESMKNETNRISRDYPAKDSEDSNDRSKIPKMEEDLKFIESRFLIIPFLKIKRGTKNKLVMLATKSYTAFKPLDSSKPSIKGLLQSLYSAKGNAWAEKESKKQFIELKNYFAVPLPRTSQGGGHIKHKQMGGEILTLTSDDIESFFPADDDDITKYNYITTEENENDSISYGDGPVPSDDSDTPVFDPDISPDKDEKNLLGELNISFDRTYSQYTNLPQIDNLKETIYTLFVYESHLNRKCTLDFDENDLTRILRDYELFPVAEEDDAIPLVYADRADAGMPVESTYSGIASTLPTPPPRADAGIPVQSTYSGIANTLPTPPPRADAGVPIQSTSSDMISTPPATPRAFLPPTISPQKNVLNFTDQWAENVFTLTGRDNKRKRDEEDEVGDVRLFPPPPPAYGDDRMGAVNAYEDAPMGDSTAQADDDVLENPSKRIRQGGTSHGSLMKTKSARSPTGTTRKHRITIKKKYVTRQRKTKVKKNRAINKRKKTRKHKYVNKQRKTKVKRNRAINKRNKTRKHK